MGRALKDAVNSGLLRTNAASRTSNKPRVQHRDGVLHNVWTADEARRFLAYVREHGSVQDATFFALALDSGCRKAELLGLQWKDLTGASLRIERQLASGGLNPTFSVPKTKRARCVDVSEETLKLFQAHKSARAEMKMKNRTTYRDHGLICVRVGAPGPDRPLGTPLSLSWLGGDKKRKGRFDL